MNDELLQELLLLEASFSRKGLRLILGGGMSLYLRHVCLRSAPGRRYPIQIESRSTNDLDFYFTSDLIVSRKAADDVRSCLALLGYEVNPAAENFQFLKHVETPSGNRTFKVDLLSAPPIERDQSRVKVTDFRIKPRGASDIHAYLTREAEGIEIGIVELDLRLLGGSRGGRSGNILLPSSYNYIIMKLNAFEDRKEKDDPKSDYGRHHALDVFATVARMNEQDWEVARSHWQDHKDRPYMRRTAEIRESCFSNRTASGLIRLRESEIYRRGSADFDPYLDQFIGDLKDLFPL